MDRPHLIPKLLCLTLLALAAPARSGATEPLAAAIDRLITAGADSGATFARRSDDAEFLRRLTLDLTGEIPTPEEVRRFLTDASADKRPRLIDQFLASDGFAAHWSERLSVMLLERRDLGKVPEADWRQFLRRSLQGQPRWDAMAREMIRASGSGETRPAMKFLGAGDHHRLTEDIARLFLGMDLKCAKCHDHPSVNDWKQADYWGLFAYLNQTQLSKPHAIDKQLYFVESLATKKVEFESVFSNEKEATGPRLPGGEEVAIPVFAKGEEFDRAPEHGLPAVPKFRPRERLADDLTAAGNAHFARNAVNRLWFLMMGRGLSHPLDQLHSQNPPSHPALMDLLAEEFVAHGFDLKWLLGEIASSDSYQRSSRLPDGDRTIEPSNYRTALPKALTAEQLLAAIARATGNSQRLQTPASPGEPSAKKFDRRGYFSGSHRDLPESPDDIRALFVETFGQAPGEAEVDFSPGANRALFLMNDRLILYWLEPRDGNLTDRLRGMTAPAAIAEELYLSALSRFPTAAEQGEVADYLAADPARRDAALGDLAWALLTSTEFRFNH